MKSIKDPALAEQIIHRVRKITPDSQRIWGKMSPNQMLCHCTDQLRMAFGEIQVKNTSNILSRTIGKFMVLRLVSAPKGKVETLPEINQTNAGTAPTTFEEDQKTLCSYIYRMTRGREKLHPHGMFGKLTESQWQRMAWLHLDHHLRQFGE